MVVPAKSLMDMIEFTKALTQYEAPSTESSEIEIGIRAERSTASCACACHPEDADTHESDYEEGVCRCKAASRANFKTAKKATGTKSTPETDAEHVTVTLSMNSGANAGEEPIIVVAHPPDTHKGPIALYPNHDCSAQCHCYLRHIPQGAPIGTVRNKESHEKPKKCSAECHCSCHKEPESAVVIECNHQCLLHCGPATELEQEEKFDAAEQPIIDVTEQSVIDVTEQPVIDATEQPVIDAAEQPVIDAEADATADASPTDSKDAKRRSSLLEKLGSKLKPASMAKASTSDGVTPNEDEQIPRTSKMSTGSQLKPASMVGGSVVAGASTEDALAPIAEDGENPPDAKRRSSGKGSILSRLSNSLRRSK